MTKSDEFAPTKATVRVGWAGFFFVGNVCLLIMGVKAQPKVPADEFGAAEC